MPGYRVVYTGHVNEMIRPGDFPTEIVSEEVFEAKNKAAVYERIQAVFQKMILFGAMGAMKPEFQNKVIDPQVSIENSMLVPNHMFSHFTVDIKELTGNFDEKGPIN